MENKLKESMDTIFKNLQNFIKTETVIGEPINIGDVTLVPIISVMFGCGAGNGNGTDNKGVNGTGTGGGGGARISPNGVVVIKKNGDVSLLPVKTKGNLEALVQMVPEIVSKINLKKCEKEKTEDKTEDKAEE